MLSEQDKRVAAHYQAQLRDLILACLDERGRRRAPSQVALRRALNCLPRKEAPRCTD